MAFLVACGNPGAENEEFVFTPAAYTPIPEGERCDLASCGAGIALTETGDRYFADHVLLAIDGSFESQILETLDRFGFEVIERYLPRSDGTLSLLVRVPLGAVPAAIEFLAEQEGVRRATPNVLLTGLDEP